MTKNKSNPQDATQASDNLTDLSQLSELGRQVVLLRHVIFERWEKYIRAHIAEATSVAHPILIDTLPAFMTNLGEALTPGYSRSTPTELSTIAQEHGVSAHA